MHRSCEWKEAVSLQPIRKSVLRFKMEASLAGRDGVIPEIANLYPVFTFHRMSGVKPHFVMNHSQFQIDPPYFKSQTLDLTGDGVNLNSIEKWDKAPFKKRCSPPHREQNKPL